MRGNAALTDIKAKLAGFRASIPRNCEGPTMFQRLGFHARVGRGVPLSAVGVLTSLCLTGPAASETAALAVDVETTVNGVQLVCTGIGQTRDEPRWRGYPVRIEFSNRRNEYLVGGAITVRDAGGRDLFSASCDAPWILLRLPKGAYQVEGRMPNAAAKSRSASFAPPAAGQLRVVLQFEDAGPP